MPRVYTDTSNRQRFSQLVARKDNQILLCNSSQYNYYSKLRCKQAGRQADTYRYLSDEPAGPANLVGFSRLEDLILQPRLERNGRCDTAPLLRDVAGHLRQSRHAAYIVKRGSSFFYVILGILPLQTFGLEPCSVVTELFFLGGGR